MNERPDMTTTVIGNLPPNWNVWEGMEPWPEWEANITKWVDADLRHMFPGGEIFRTGSEILGPATIRFGPNKPGKFLTGTPDVDEIKGVEKLENDDWIRDMMRRAGEACSHASHYEEAR